MKTLIIVRHAKSSWDDISMKDIDRPLNHRGKKDAPEMAKRLMKKSVIPDIFLSSPAVRAVKTARFFLKEFDKKSSELKIVPGLYEASVPDFYSAVEEISNNYKTAILFSHNPGITEFVNDLDCMPIYNMSTCGMYAVQADSDDWKDFRVSDKSFLFYDFPKKED